MNITVFLLKKIKYENEFFQQKDYDIHNQRPFFVHKMKIPKKWQIPLMKCMIYTLGQREGQTNGNKMNNLGRETKKILGRAFSITDHFPSAHSSLT